MIVLYTVVVLYVCQMYLFSNACMYTHVCTCTDLGALTPVFLHVPQDLRPDGAYLYVAIVYNTSITLALIALLLFYVATRDLLR